MFSVWTVPPDSTETELGSSYQEASPLAGKNTRVILVSYCAWKYTHTVISGDLDISEVPGCYLLRQMSFQGGSQKLLQGLVSSHELTVYLFDFNLNKMAILSKGRKSDNFKLHNSLKLSFTNIRGLRSNFVECQSFLESSSPKNLVLRQTNLGDSIDFSNFSVRGYLPLIQKDYVIHIHGLGIHVKKGLPFGWDLSLEILFMFSTGFHSLSYFFFLYRSHSSLCIVFNAISSNIDEVLLISPPANVFVFGDFNVHFKDRLT